MELVTIFVDDREIKVPKGMNLIEAARLAGVEIPHYCYHTNLSIAGNCRMCQVKVEGQPKLPIACNTGAVEGMKVRTHLTSDEVVAAQRATLEFLLINHPLDCTVCDQAGHCKLQDYYYEYDARPSRFVEDKTRKVKAEPLGPEIIYDGERCIACTRCSRFCEEVTGTSELGLFNRGDHAVIGAYPGKELDNPLSGTVVDLCPVGALTHRRWRFNTRIWYTSLVDSICTGCSTGCNTLVAIRDGRIVHVKARMNQAVNKEWMCDEGRYGFERFQPETRLTDPFVREADAEQKSGGFKQAPWDQALQASAMLKDAGAEGAVFLSPFLTLEEMWVAVQFAEQVMKTTVSSGAVTVQLRRRGLTDVEKILISPDYAPNARAALLLGIISEQGDGWRAVLEGHYLALLDRLKRGALRKVLFVGDHALAPHDVSAELLQAIARCPVSVQLTPRGVAGGEHRTFATNEIQFRQVLLPGRSVNEKNGVMMNGQGRIQKLQATLQAPVGSMPEWMLLRRMAEAAGTKIVPGDIQEDRALFRHVVQKFPALSGLTLHKLGALGLTVEELQALKDENKEEARAAG